MAKRDRFLRFIIVYYLGLYVRRLDFYQAALESFILLGYIFLSIA